MSLIIICGATATGKSDLALAVAKEINGNRSIGHYEPFWR